MVKCCDKKKAPVNFTDGALLSEYKKEYIEKEAPHGRSERILIPGKGYVDSKAELAGKSTFKNDYPEWPLPGDRKGRKKEEPIKHRPIDDHSTYKDHYPPKAGIPNDLSTNVNIMRNQLAPGDLGFESATTHKTDYPKWDADPAKSQRPPGGVIAARPFDHDSSYKADYKRWEAARLKPRIPAAPLKDLPLNGASTYNQDYPGFINAANRKKCCDRKKAPTEWADGALATEYQRKYDEKAATYPGRVRAPRPDLANAPLKGISTFKNDYPEWPLGAPYPGHDRGRPIAHRPFNDDTTYNNHYTNKKGMPDDWRKTNVNTVRAQLVDGSGPFYDETTHLQDYPGWPTNLPADHRPHRGVIAARPFDANTTYKGDYVKHKGLPPQQRKKAELLPNMHTANITTYGQDFIPKPLAKPRRVCCDRPWTVCSSCVDDEPPVTIPPPTMTTTAGAAVLALTAAKA